MQQRARRCSWHEEKPQRIGAKFYITLDVTGCVLGLLCGGTKPTCSGFADTGGSMPTPARQQMITKSRSRPVPKTEELRGLELRSWQEYAAQQERM